MNDTIIPNKQLQHLKNAVTAYELALENDYVPSGVEENYIQGTDEWIGERPDEIANDICRLINLL